MKFILDGLKRRIEPNPTIETADNILEEARGSTEIVSIGGGSTIDIGKYISWKLGIKHTAIPTTAGTGSEVTKFAVFIKDGKKITIEDEKLIPDNYILDPERVVSLSPFQTASTGLDALCHAIESWWSPNSTKESRSYAKRALKGLVRDLYDSYCYPYSQTLRWKMLEHANYAGRAINITRTSICHAISYPLTVHYGIPHGIACARTLPFFIRYFGFYRIDAKKIEKLLRGLNANFNTEIDKEMVAEKALQSERVNNTPLPVTKEIILKSL